MSKRKDTPTFVQEATVKHSGFYCYDEVEYLSAHNPVIIICPQHGKFTQRPNDHLRGKGCQNCANQARGSKTSKSKTKTLEKFLADARSVHGNVFSYNNVLYSGSSSKITITCYKHGDFTQAPASHLAGSGCPKCKSRVSKKETEWLDQLDIHDSCRQQIVTIKGKRFSVDALVGNIVYEYNGDFWHGNPDVYQSGQKHPMMNLTFGEVFNRTLAKERILKDAGFIVCSKWESDDIEVYSKRFTG